MRRHWIISAPFDLAFLLGPPFFSLVVLALSPARLFARDDLPTFAWLILIPLVDVSHVYASLYRTYFDRSELCARGALLCAVPAAAFIVGTMLYAVDGRLFWTVLAYAAVFHFVRQQYGFLELYRLRAGEPRSRLDTTLLYLGMLYPVVWWHTHLPRKFVWFIEGDFVALPARGLSQALGWIYAATVVAYVAKELAVIARGRPIAIGKNLVLVSTALTWYVGIVVYDSDWSFTVTNVISHGAPYVALVWVVCRRKWRSSEPSSWLAIVTEPRFVLVFVGILAALAIVEEGLWDVLVWGDHPALFGGRQNAAALAGSPLLAFAVGALAVPQTTHYVLDGYIWKMNAANRELRELLLDEPRSVGELSQEASLPSVAQPFLAL